MADLTRLIRSWDKAISATNDRLKRRGQVGRINASGSPTVEVPGTNGRLVYVRLGSGGSDGVIEAVPRNVSRRAHTYVKVHQEDGQWIAQADDSAINQNGSGNAAVGPHTHRRNSGNEYVAEAELFAPGIVLPSSGLTVSIGSFRYPNGVSGETYTGGTIDLTSHVPGTANKWRWVLVGVDPSTNAAIAVSGSDFDTQAELTRAEIDNVAFDGYIPLAAIQVANGDTALTDHSRYYDARPWFVPSRGQTDYTFDLNSEGALTVTNANTGNAATAGIRLESDVSVGQLFATGENYAANGWADAIVAVTNAAGGFIWQSSNIRLQNVAGTDAMQVTTGNVIMSGNLTVPTVYGSAAASGNLTLESTSHATKGNMLLQPNGGNVGIGGTPMASTQFEIIAQGAAAVSSMRSYRDSAVNHAAFQGFGARGTIGSEAVLNDGDNVLTFSARGWDGSAFQVVGQLLFQAQGTQSAGSTPGKFAIQTTPNSSTTPTNRLEIYRDGRFGVTGYLGEAWTAPSFNTGWANFGGSFQTAAYKKFGDLVILRGTVVRSSGSETTIFTLPSGYRPPARVLFTAIGNSALARIDISSAGEVILSIGAPTSYLTLDGIFFSTAS